MSLCAEKYGNLFVKFKNLNNHFVRIVIKSFYKLTVRNLTLKSKKIFTELRLIAMNLVRRLSPAKISCIIF